MSSELERRTAIIVALRCGPTVYSIAKSFKESEDIEEGFLTPERKTPDRSQVRKRSADFIDAALTSTPANTTCGGVLERDTNKRAHNTMDSLKAAIIQAVANLSREQ
ncbi:Transposable element tcb1 transposase, partial [Caligus rogercresseyi]